MEIPKEVYLIVDILCYLNHQKYLKEINIKCTEYLFFNKITNLKLEILNMENQLKNIKK
jgi:hypothetical protein